MTHYCFLKNDQGDHIYKQIENLHTVCVQTAERHLRGIMAFTMCNHIDEGHGFYGIKFDHVASHDTVLFMEL